ncbi:MAG TPA: ATP-binding protein [Actinocrinis sp.]|jgi:signal transduction histidine kinase
MARGHDRTLAIAAAAAAAYLVLAAGWLIVAVFVPAGRVGTSLVAGALRFAVPGGAFAMAGLLVAANRAARVAGRVLSATAVATVLPQFAQACAQIARPGPAATALAGLAFMAGAGLRPLALWTSRCVERFYYGHRAEPYRLLRGLAAAAGRAPDPDRVPEALCRSIADALRLPGVALQARSRTGTRIQAEVGTFDHGSHALDLVYQGEIVGRMRVGLRAAERELAPQDREVLDSLADQVAAAITALRLYKDLQHSTERLVVAREEERRRLRRDIHDGLGPAALTNLGLADAVAELARRFSVGGLTVACVLEAYRPGSDLSAAVEAAAYRITAEALNNAARHAQARGAEVRLTADGTALVLDVRDDGVGLPDAVRGGVGLESVARRAAELGGTFQIMAADRGTHLRATLPIAHTP